MREISIQIANDDTLFDRVASLAVQRGTTSQDIIERAIAAYLGDFGLNPVPEGFRPKNVLELAQKRGLFKTEEN